MAFWRAFEQLGEVIRSDCRKRILVFGLCFILYVVGFKLINFGRSKLQIVEAIAIIIYIYW